jgi:hypothetical protein
VGRDTLEAGDQITHPVLRILGLFDKVVPAVEDRAVSIAVLLLVMAVFIAGDRVAGEFVMHLVRHFGDVLI